MTENKVAHKVAVKPCYQNHFMVNIKNKVFTVEEMEELIKLLKQIIRDVDA